METIKQIRIKIFNIIYLVSMLPSSREISLSKTNLERSRMFLGKVLQESFADVNPYPDSMNPGNDKIEPTADIERDASVKFLPLDTDIGRIKRVRNFIEEQLIVMRKEYQESTYHNNIYSSEFWMTAYLSLTEAKMWLGVELARIRDVNEGKVTAGDPDFMRGKKELTVDAHDPATKMNPPPGGDVDVSKSLGIPSGDREEIGKLSGGSKPT